MSKEEMKVILDFKAPNSDANIAKVNATKNKVG